MVIMHILVIISTFVYITHIQLLIIFKDVNNRGRFIIHNYQMLTQNFVIGSNMDSIKNYLPHT